MKRVFWAVCVSVILGSPTNATNLGTVIHNQTSSGRNPYGTISIPSIEPHATIKVYEKQTDQGQLTMDLKEINSRLMAEKAAPDFQRSENAGDVYQAFMYLNHMGAGNDVYNQGFYEAATEYATCLCNIQANWLDNIPAQVKTDKYKQTDVPVTDYIQQHYNINQLEDSQLRRGAQVGLTASPKQPGNLELKDQDKPQGDYKLTITLSLFDRQKATDVLFFVGQLVNIMKQVNYNGDLNQEIDFDWTGAKSSKSQSIINGLVEMIQSSKQAASIAIIYSGKQFRLKDQCGALFTAVGVKQWSDVMDVLDMIREAMLGTYDVQSSGSIVA